MPSLRSAATTAATIETRPLHAVDRWLAARLQATIAPASIGVELWDGSTTGPPGQAIGDLLIHDRGALLGLIANPDLQFGELYSDGRLDVRGPFGEVVEALSRLTKRDRLALSERWALWTARPAGLLVARRNIHRHYDIGNDFYRRWLDPDLVYTCAHYPDPDATLEAAQAEKLELVCRKVDLRPGDEVVEAGCGWGALALYMARHYGVRVRAFNISSEQLDFARARAAREGLTDRVQFIADDYRNISGRCDVFVSVGMLEHVGLRNFGALAGVLRRTLDSRSGRGLLHFIGRDRRRPLNAWIRRRIFPGAYVPTLSEVTTRVLEPAGLSVVDVENLRQHYARTLAHWWERYEGAVPELRASFDERFIRAWRLYLAGSQAAFSTGWLQLFQVVFAPPDRLVHWARAGLYNPPRETA